ncbi:MAG: guanosine polyphosphate pyrophosphohydrolase [Oscillospiraceae bacterium]|nr:guanosine polyphosphate pyrophosphohydrolase [Oscillospiraceae bacterium]
MKDPYLAFTFKGRIKSLIRAEEKFNGYIVEYIYDHYEKTGTFPAETDIKNHLQCFRDLIAYRILYEIANVLPEFLEERGFTAELSGLEHKNESPLLQESLRPYYRDYISNTRPHGYQSLHITLYDNVARCFTEVQLRTKDMDDHAEIGEANHFGYEKKQESDRARREAIPVGVFPIFDEAYDRVQKLQTIDLSKVEVNMFTAIDNYLINDGCGLFRGRQILPFEHLSRFQNDLID